ncbi:MAG: two-partner secretion system exoprotein TpsA4 [Oscillatoriaceae cyanobacterium]
MKDNVIKDKSFSFALLIVKLFQIDNYHLSSVNYQLSIFIGLILGNIASLLLINPEPAQCQIIPDSSLGNESSRITPDTINGLPTDRIDGGAIRGSNLFHSFSEFNIEAGKGAYFTNPNGIDHIFSRVTGSNISQINGTLGVLGNANLFFINPNGIVFGPNSRLDLRGSFVGATAESVLFDQSIEWGTTNPQAPPLLTVNIPIGLQFRSNTGTIEVQSTSGLEVAPGQTLALLGGDINLNGGKLNAPGGSIQLGAYEGSLFSAPLAPGLNIRLNNGATIFNNSTDATSGGSIKLHARETVSLAEDSIISAENRGNSDGAVVTVETDSLTVASHSYISTSTFTRGNAGNLIVNSRDIIINGNQELSPVVEALFNIKIDNPEQLGTGLFALSFASGNAGKLEIKTDRLSLQNAGFISTSPFAAGRGGDLQINAAESVELIGSQILADNYSSGDGGIVTVNTGSFRAVAGGGVFASTFGSGRGGEIDITATDSIELIGTTPDEKFNTGLFANAYNQATTAAGNLNIITPRLTIRDGAAIAVATVGAAAAGTVRISGADLVEISGSSPSGKRTSGLFAAVEQNAQGNGGSLTVETGQLILKDGARISSGTSGVGNAGNVDIRARELVQLTGSFVESDTRGAGAGGDITIDTRRLEVSDRAYISTSTFDSGAGGSIKVNAAESVELLGNGYSDFTEKVIQNFFNRTISLDDRIVGIYAGTQGSGNAGNIEIETGQLLLQDGSILFTPTFGTGAGGEINIRASERAEIQGSGIGASVLTSGVGGSINIDTKQVILGQGTLVANSTVGDGNAGNIVVLASELVQLDSTPVGGPIATGIYSNTIGGAGAAGNIIVTTPYLLMRDGAQISTGTGFNTGEGLIPFGGKGGNLFINDVQRVELNGISADGRFRTTLNSGTLSNADAGSLSIEADTLILRDGAEISGSTTGPGVGGSMTVRSQDVQLLGISPDGKYRSAISVRAEATGNGGSLDLETARLLVTGGALVEASTYGNGNAGSLNIIATDRTEIQGASAIGRSGLFASAVNGGTGSGGNLTLHTGELRIRDGATIAASNFHSRDLIPPGFGPAGNISITANSIRLDNGASLSVRAASGDKGNINLTARDIIAVGNSRINTDATGTATGGNIAVNAENLVAVDNSDISANAQQSFGGRVLVSAGGIFGTRFRPNQTQKSDITASSDLGAEFSGTVEINTPAVDPSSGLVTLPENFVDLASVLGADACAQGSSSSFVVTGRGGLPPNPTASLGSDASASSWIDVSRFVVGLQPKPVRSALEHGDFWTTGPGGLLSSSPISPSPQRGLKPYYEPGSAEIVLARGWVRNHQGEVVLTSYDPTGYSPQRPPKTADVCR